MSTLRTRITRILDAHEIPYPVLVDSERQIAMAYKVGVLPTTVIIGRDGKVKLYHIGYRPGDENRFEHLVRSLVK